MPTTATIPTFLRFKDLQARRIVTSWPQLRHMQRQYGFPPGRLLGANSRAWTEAEIQEWLASCPVEPSQHVMERAEKSKRARREVSGQAA
jgi:predicted DNA-binding transcriptional regulator AlpA